jgi:hypothetical protein
MSRLTAAGSRGGDAGTLEADRIADHATEAALIAERPAWASDAEHDFVVTVVAHNPMRSTAVNARINVRLARTDSTGEVSIGDVPPGSTATILLDLEEVVTGFVHAAAEYIEITLTFVDGRHHRMMQPYRWIPDRRHLKATCGQWLPLPLHRSPEALPLHMFY